MKKVHFMGIAGSGMNAVASIAHSMGYAVSGCDFSGSPSEYTKSLESEGVPLSWEHNESHLAGVDILCVTPAVFDLSNQHPEFVKAKQMGMPVMTWQEFMGKELQVGKDVVSIAGTKGKTTTTALVGVLMEKAGLDPIVEVGGKVLDWQKNYRNGNGKWFVCEADEFNNNFLNYSSKIGVITNIEMDHPEFFSSYDEYLRSFKEFVEKIPEDGVLIVNSDDKGVQALLKKLGSVQCRLLKFGTDYSLDVQLVSDLVVNTETGVGEFVVAGVEKENRRIQTRLFGMHNVYNSLALLTLAKHLGISVEVVEDVLLKFKGVGRRMELIGEAKGAILFNDYAHNPMSVQAVLSGVRLRYPEARIWAVLQPHMYSRTKLLMNEYAGSFKAADEVIITDIFASREKGKPIEKEVSSQMLVAKVQEVMENSGKQVRYVPTNLVVTTLFDEVREGDVVVNMGAGDNTIFVTDLFNKLSGK